MAPRYVVVDKNDDIIAYKFKEELVAGEDIMRVTLAWITNSNGDVLLTQRSANKRYDPEKWGPAVAGTVEEGETYQDNMRKEIQEEIGVQINEMEEGPKIFMELENSYFCQVFLIKADLDISTLSLEPLEVQNVKWIPEVELKKQIQNAPQHFIRSFEKYVGEIYST